MNYIDLFNSILGQNEYTLVKNREVEAYMCNKEIAIDELSSDRCCIGKYEGLPKIINDKIYQSTYEQDFMPLVYERRSSSSNNKFDLLQDFIMCYDLISVIENDSVVSYHTNDETEKVVVVIENNSFFIKTSYIKDYLQKSNKSLLFFVELNVQDNDSFENQQEQLKLLLTSNIYTPTDNYPYVNFKVLFPM